MKIKALFYLFCFVSIVGYTQEDTLNRLDENNLRQGYWVLYGKDFPKRDYPPDGKVEEGVYVDNKKHGNWKKYHKDGKTVRLIGWYEDGQPKGHYQKFYESGQLMEEGYFEQGKMVMVTARYFEDGSLSMSKRFNEEGKEDGWITWYYSKDADSGSTPVPEYRIEKENGKTKRIMAYYKSGCLKRMSWSDDNGIESKQQFYCNDCDIALDTIGTLAGNCSSQEESNVAYRGMTVINTVPTHNFDPNGENIIYNNDGEIWKDGKFKKGELWNGEIYHYDQDGILIKIEIWKKGKYVADGEL